MRPIGELSSPALPFTADPLFALRPRERALPSRYVPLALESRVAFTTNTATPVQAQVGGGASRADDKAQRASGSRPAAAKPANARAGMPVHTVKSTAPGQSGYVHFFLLELPDGETETQVGIELPDGRIAWSFPDVGVSVSPFIQAGRVEMNGKLYGVQHMYGLRPFPDDASMLALGRELWERVIPWVEDQIPYCNSALRPEQLCLSCLGFALHVLFPGRTPAYPGLPTDFPRTASRLYYTTDDLLLYLTGLHLYPNREARLARLNELTLPDLLRQELTELSISIEANDVADAPRAAAPRTLSDKVRSGVRTYTRTPPQKKRL